jgi:hypothetical protein
MVNKNRGWSLRPPSVFIIFGGLWIPLLVLPRLVLVLELVVSVTWLAEHHTPAALPKKQVQEYTKERYQPDRY